MTQILEPITKQKNISKTEAVVAKIVIPAQKDLSADEPLEPDLSEGDDASFFFGKKRAQTCTATRWLSQILQDHGARVYQGPRYWTRTSARGACARKYTRAFRGWSNATLYDKLAYYNMIPHYSQLCPHPCLVPTLIFDLN